MTAMAASAEELELQDQVTRALESQGVLGKIKAQLRAAVFQTIHNAGHTGPGSRPSQSSVVPAAAMLQSFGANAPVALELVRNFLECLELDHTLTVFLAEAGLDGKSASEWRIPARLCEHVGVSKADEATPVLIKLLREERRDPNVERKHEAVARVAEPAPVLQPLDTRGGGLGESNFSDTLGKSQVTSRTVELPPPSVKATPAPVTHQPYDDDGEMETSMAEEVASGSFEEESVAESASVSHNQSEDVQHRSAPGRFTLQREGEDEEPSPSIASPPPVPTKLGPLPTLPGMGSMNKPSPDASGDEDEEETEHPRITEPDDHDDDDEELDDDAAAARLRSLEEKLKAMEAEDDTGLLQQLKETALTDAEDAEPTPSKANKPDDDDDGDDNYGSDFEEEVEEQEEEEEVASELSEDIASMSMLSDSAEVAPTIPPLSALDHDKRVDNEDALNSYDYIETVERD